MSDGSHFNFNLANASRAGGCIAVSHWNSTGLLSACGSFDLHDNGIVIDIMIGSCNLTGHRLSQKSQALYSVDILIDAQAMAVEKLELVAVVLFEECLFGVVQRCRRGVLGVHPSGLARSGASKTGRLSQCDRDLRSPG